MLQTFRIEKYIIISPEPIALSATLFIRVVFLRARFAAAAVISIVDAHCGFRGDPVVAVAAEMLIVDAHCGFRGDPVVAAAAVISTVDAPVVAGVTSTVQTVVPDSSAQH